MMGKYVALAALTFFIGFGIAWRWSGQVGYDRALRDEMAAPPLFDGNHGGSIKGCSLVFHPANVRHMPGVHCVIDLW